MTVQDMIAKIREHERACAQSSDTAFKVAKVYELAAGVLAVVDTDGQWFVCFDKDRYQLSDDSPLDDEGLNIPGFPEGLGFFEELMSEDLDSITAAAMICIARIDGADPDWHENQPEIAY